MYEHIYWTAGIIRSVIANRKKKEKELVVRHCTIGSKRKNKNIVVISKLIRNSFQRSDLWQKRERFVPPLCAFFGARADQWQTGWALPLVTFKPNARFQIDEYRSRWFSTGDDDNNFSDGPARNPEANPIKFLLLFTRLKWHSLFFYWKTKTKMSVRNSAVFRPFLRAALYIFEFIKKNKKFPGEIDTVVFSGNI